ncbi:hypothetical protein PHJA_001079200 [Phtheirospermum japonicum]|uniref:NB-ARC domain-containing protein n=1 Tax=Phtheirospermum japonicum TaxID=374723 RepID=A0A830C1S4_9LAMI|nr:hypothetical protein PHJA_001079200 [Phtheirospermum japonicum]
MAAYAALVSVTHTIDQIHNHPRPPICFDKEQIQPLTGKVTFFQEFLEGYSNINDGDSEVVDPLEGRIADTSYAVEDVIESHIVDTIEAANSTSTDCHLYQGLEKVIQDLDSKVMEIKEKTTKVQGVPVADAVGSLRRSPSFTGQDTAVGLDDVLVEVMDKLTGQQPDRWIISIIGMGGIGKTTLAKTIYAKPLIVEHFEFRGWATIS